MDSRPWLPIDSRPPDAPLRPASEDERGAIGVNFCQPPLLPLLPREAIAPPALPGRFTAPELRPSNPRSPPAFDRRFEPPPSRPLLNDRPFDPVPVVPRLVPRAEKKCWFCDTPRLVDAAAERPLAEKLSRPGVTGSLPVAIRAFWNCACVIACALMCPVPNSLPETVVPPRKFRSCIARFTLENRDPARNGAKPPWNPPKRP